MYINKLNKIVDKYNDAHYRKIKMKPVDVKSQVRMLTLMLRIMTKILNLNVVIMRQYQITATIHIVLKNVKTVPWI